MENSTAVQKKDSGMALELSPVRKAGFIVALLMTNFILCYDFAFFPIVNVIYELFPDNLAMTNFLVSGPYFFIMVGALVAPLLMKKVSKRMLLIIAGIAFCVTSIGGALVVNVYYMTACRAVIGFCYGIYQVCGLGLIAEVFIDEGKKASFMGYFNASMALLASLLGILAGNLAVSGWQNAFDTYWIGVIMVVLVIVFVPDTRHLAPADEASESTGKVSMKGFPARLWAMLIVFFLLCTVAVIPFLTFFSLYVEENALGDAAFVGLLSSANMIGMFLFCLGFGLVRKKVGPASSLVFVAGATLALLAICLIKDPIVATVATFLSGGFYGCMYSYVFAEAAIILPPEKVDGALGVMAAVIAGIGLLYSYIQTGLMGLMGTDLVTPVYFVYVGLGCLALVIEFVSLRAEKKKA